MNKPKNTKPTTEIPEIPEVTPQEIARQLGLKTITSDIITEHIFMDNRNNALYTEIVNEVKKLYDFEPIPIVEKMTVQKADAPEVLDDKKMIADMSGESREKSKEKKSRRTKHTNVGMEIQKAPQSDFPERIVLSFANRTKANFRKGGKYANAPDVIQIGIATSKLKKLSSNKNFVSCIDMFTIRETGEKLFPDDKYQMFFIELSKMPKSKEKLDKKYHALWDICKVLKTPYKDMERTIKMAKITNKTALKLSKELRKAVVSPQTAEWEERRQKAINDRERERQRYEGKIRVLGQDNTKLQNQLVAEQQARLAEQQARLAEQQAYLTEHQAYLTEHQARLAAERRIKELETQFLLTPK